ncbi:Hpt domain-containing protein [Pseudomonas sp. KHPS1]|jgi:HD-GYP domain-containing protein (c-di-GMP phosphodiesterase class II)|uniref:Metal dependent phosphohydrolase n=1 Tax=Ectopseudomonas mendocina (strain ymp) TaxID=399739 RepID=A4XRR6_ECTM1|nr:MULTISPECIES: HD domain-containing phosphohydrolase [unclassified Pseudomonas]MBA4243377.1 HD domain-containing protein [Pseudomonas sp.]UTH37777.1 Hpt domain-containing protein [Pseudomonas sp. KHPS1]
MPLPRLADLSSDLLEDFRLDAADQFPRCEQLLIELEHAPRDGERLRELFRLVHTLKGNLGYIDLNALMPLPQAMEDVLDALRSGRLAFDSLLGDILLLTLDHLQALVGQALGGPDARLSQTQFEHLCQALQALAVTPAERQTEARRTLLQQIDPSTRLQAPPALAESPTEALLARHGIAADPDLQFFAALTQAAEQRSHYWRGRNLRLLDLALSINAQGGQVERPEQLAAAVCLHDLGMAFLPLELLHKQADLSRDERRLVHGHPRLASELLKRMPDWAPAMEIILQHQEHADGSGYPKGLRETEIAPGALILNIVDTFDARTHERAHQTLSKRPLLRAILEINNLAGQQFSAHWVDVFNRTLQQRPNLAHG